MTRRTTYAALMLVCTAMLPACATVDIAEMTTPSARAEAPAEVNVVQRAVEKLKTAFSQRGFGPKDSKRKMHAAADMLLNGIGKATETDTGDDYNAVARSPESVTADITLANRHVVQTTRAAEVYLEMAPRDRKLTDELSSLEAALLVSEKAVRVFTVAMDDAETVELNQLRDSVDGLRRVTDEFGIRVRMDRSGKLAVAAASRGDAS